MKNKVIIFMLISMLLSACNLSNSSGNDEQIVSMQQTIDAMQQSQNQNNEATSEPQAAPPTQATSNQQPLTDVPANTSQPIQPQVLSSSLWTTDTTGVCRDDAGGYPRWSAYDWNISQCEQACLDNPNCQGFAMSKDKDYCQLFGSDGANDASSSGTQITRGDNSYPEYICYIKQSTSSSGTTANDSPEPTLSVLLLGQTVQVLEFDNQTPVADGCNSSRQDMNQFGNDLWSEGDQLFGYGLRCSIAFTFRVYQTGTYKMVLHATYAPDFGNIRIRVYQTDKTSNIEKIVDDINLYDSSVRPSGAINLQNRDFSADKIYSIVFENIGKDQFSSDYKFGIDYLTWEPVQ